ncbi:MAG TPA: hypothetical protein VHM27_02890 [Rhizomicrobium sp.]|nr:hypothetical protein [Rhizomicrobium sp.]
MAANSALLAVSASAAQIHRKPVYRAGLECHDGASHWLEPPPPRASTLTLTAAAEPAARLAH